VSIRPILILGALAIGCGTGPPPDVPIRRLGAAIPWRHCLLAGESRPAQPCADLHLLTSGKDVAVPAGGTLAVPLPAPTGGDGPVLVVTEAHTYEAPPTDDVGRAVHLNLASILASGRTDRTLERLLGRHATFRAAPQPPGVRYVRTPPLVRLRFAPPDQGRQAAYAVWGWRPGRPVLALERLTARAGDRLTIAFGVQDAGWRRADAPVTFTVAAGEEVLWRRTIDPVGRMEERGWLEDEIDLDRHAGRSLGLVLAARTEPGPEGEPLDADFATWARPAIVRRPPGPEPPSVLLLSLDTLRADHVGAYGYARATTPALDRLAARGVLFEQAIAHFPSTTASHMTMLTSLEPCAHGVLVPGSVLGPGVPTLAEAFAARGWATVAVTENALIRGESGFNRGFDSYRDILPTGADPLGLFTEVLARARSWLARHGERPFFMFLHTYQVHIPYKVPPHYRDLFPVPADASEARRQEADYDAGLRHADDLLGGFVDALAADGLLGRTLLVVTSDHGTEFDEHGGIGHARGVYEEQVRVPLVLHHPVLATGGRRVRAQVGLVDLAPTLLDLVGAAAPETFSGTSLAAAVRGVGELPAARPLFAEQLWGPRQTLLRSDGHAWIQKADGLELYDLGSDPREQRDVAAERAARVAEGARRIATFRHECLERSFALRAGAGEKPLEPERRDALRALGYVE
jgi:arylsulfatase A-like enzyme